VADLLLGLVSTAVSAGNKKKKGCWCGLSKGKIVGPQAWPRGGSVNRAGINPCGLPAIFFANNLISNATTIIKGSTWKKTGACQSRRFTKQWFFLL